MSFKFKFWAVLTLLAVLVIAFIMVAAPSAKAGGPEITVTAQGQCTGGPSLLITATAGEEGPYGLTVVNGGLTVGSMDVASGDTQQLRVELSDGPYSVTVLLWGEQLESFSGTLNCTPSLLPATPVAPVVVDQSFVYDGAGVLQTISATVTIPVTVGVEYLFDNQLVTGVVSTTPGTHTYEARALDGYELTHPMYIFVGVNAGVVPDPPVVVVPDPPVVVVPPVDPPVVVVDPPVETPIVVTPPADAAVVVAPPVETPVVTPPVLGPKVVTGYVGDSSSPSLLWGLKIIAIGVLLFVVARRRSNNKRDKR